MAGEQISNYVDFRNQTFMDFGVVARVSVAGREQREFLFNSDVGGRSWRHHASKSFLVPLERSDGGYAWDPLTEDRLEYESRQDESAPVTGTYEVPESLHEFSERFSQTLWCGLIAYEVGVRETKMCQVVTGYSGEPVYPTAKQSRDKGMMDEVDWHCRAWFLGDKLGRVRVNPEKSTLSIDRSFSQMDESGSTLAVQGEVLTTDIPARMFKNAPRLPARLGNWQPALDGLYRRLNCYRTSCGTAHYYDANVPE